MPAMLLIAAALATSLPQAEPVTTGGAAVQARAIIRVLTGARIRLGEDAISGDAPAVHMTVAHADGAAKPARLIEFE